MTWKKILLALLALLGLVLTFGSEGAFESSLSTGNTGEKGTIRLAYVNWDSEIASSNVIAQVLESQGYNVEMIALDNAIMWQSVATGDADAMVSAWLPITHGAQYKEYGDQMDDLGTNLEGAVTGLTVPSYMTIDSIADLSDQAGKVITGIEPGAGITESTKTALEEYPNLSDWQLSTSSSGAMTTQLGQAIKNKEPIIVTGWTPHWMFQEYDLKFLADPKNVYGEGDSIHTMVRKNLKADLPEAYAILDRFHWDLDDMQSVMVDINRGERPDQAAKKWIEAHPDLIAKWVNSTEKHS